MYPDADIPVTQLSVVHGAGPEEHERIGRALAGLREEGVLVVGSGSLTHNLYEFRGQGIDAPVPHWVSEFEAWMKARLEDSDRAALLAYRRAAPFATHNHPTEEHLLPLFVAMGAAGPGAGATQLHASFEHGVLAMDAYAFQ
jgi:4,5-DOPA dioxygenase extradiol